MFSQAGAEQGYRNKRRNDRVGAGAILGAKRSDVHQAVAGIDYWTPEFGGHPMRAEGLQRRVAAWLLSLPRPIDAADQSEAQKKACRQFDPNASEEAFSDALKRLGYAIAKSPRSGFVIHCKH
jgi:hypothetical protein